MIRKLAGLCFALLWPLSAAPSLPLVFEPLSGGGFAARGFLIQGTSASAGGIGMRLIGAKGEAAPLDPLPGVSHYFLGGKAATSAPQYGRVRVADAYPGIDLVYYANGQRLEYDLAVRPGADPHRIAIEFTGAKPRIENGALVVGGLRWDAPRIYQEARRVRKTIAGAYALHGQRVTFAIGRYDRRYPLIIDPVLSFATFLSGFNDNRALGTAVAPDGSIVVAGYTSAPNFPLHNAAQGTYAGGRDAFVARFSADGATLLSSTYIGGSSDDQANGVAVDGAGNIWVAGTTSSGDFPTASPIYSSFGGGSDAFLLELNASGNSVRFSTFIGGSGNDTGNAVAAQGTSFACLTGSTQSFDFPVRNAYQNARYGSSDAFVGCFDGSVFRYLTLLGGSSDESGSGIALDAARNAYVTGYTTSGDFPLSGAYQSKLKTAHSAFVTKLTANGMALAYSTYLGGSNYDSAYAIAVDLSGSAYVTGETYSADFPTTAGAFQTTAAANDNVFVTKLNPSGSGLAYSTYLGGSGNEVPYGISVDPIGNAHVVGSTASPDFPVANATQSAINGGAQRMYRSADGGQTWANISGGLPVQQVAGVAVSPTDANVAWVASCPGVWKTSDGGGSWTQVGTSTINACISAVAVSPVDPNRLFAGTYNSTLFTSADGGSTWTQIAQGQATSTVNAIVFDAAGANAFFGADGGLIYRIPLSTLSVNQTFQAGGGSVRSLAFDPANTSQLYAATSTGVYVSANGGNIFTQATNGIPTNTYSASVFADTGAVYAGQVCALSKSVNSGASWTSINNGLLNQCVYAIAESSGSLLATTQAPGIYRSTDGGAHWTITSGVLSFGTALTVAPSNSSVVYAGAFPGNDGFVTKLNPLGTGLIYSTYLGGSTGYEESRAIAATSTDAYIAGWTGNVPLGAPFPITPGAFQKTSAGYADAYLVRLTDSSCAYSLNRSSASVGSSGGAGNLVLTASPACPWIFMANVPWIIATGAASGSGGATIGYQVLANTTTLARSGLVSVGGKVFSVSQDPGTTCSYSLSTTTLNPAGAGGGGSVGVTTGAGCNWTVSSTATWITAPAGGTGPGYASFSFAANTTGASRTASATVAGQTVTITQAATACAFTLPRSAFYALAAASNLQVSINANSTGCAWTTSSTTAWLTPSPASGTGTLANVLVAANTGAARTGSVTIAGQTVTVTQDGPGVAAPVYFSFTAQNLAQSPSVAEGRLMDLGYAGPTLVLAQNDGSGDAIGMLAFGSDGTGKFTSNLTTTVLGASPPTTQWWRDFALADFDGDGRDDLFISDTGPDFSPFPGGQNHLLLQKTKGVLTDATSTNLPQELGFSHSVAAGDIDNNGSMDLYIGNIYSSHGCGGELWINNGSGVFTKNTSQLPAAVTTCAMKFTTARFVDVDKNGTLDLVLGGAPDSSTIAQPTDTILLNDGHGNFTFAPPNAMPPRLGGPTWTTWGMAVADVDNDGWPDIVALMVDNGAGVSFTKMQLLLNNGDGTFRDASNRVPNDWVQGNAFLEFVTAVDLNGDGYMDLVVRANNANAAVLLNTGKGQFVRVNDLLTLPNSLTWDGARWLYARDLNNDTKPDLVIDDHNVSQISVGINTNPLPQVGACGFGLSSSAVSVTAAGGPAAANVTAGKTCRWITSAEASWISTSSGVSTGPGTGAVMVAPSTSGQQRSAIVLMAGQPFTVTQQGLACSFVLNASALSIAVSGATGQVGITTSPADCAWSVSSNAAWIIPVTGGAQGSAAVGFTVAANSGSARSGVLTIGGQTFTVNQDGVPAVLSVTKSHIGSLAQGQNNAAYTITIANGAGAGATTGTVTMTESVPSGMTLVSMAGAGWNCPVNGSTCTRSDALAGGSAYPPITAVVNVAASAASPQVNSVSVSGGGSATAGATDSTTIVSAFTDAHSSDFFFDAVNLMREYGITAGCQAAPPMYCPNDNVTRAQMAIFIVRAVLGGDNFSYSATAHFSDVPSNAFGFQWIQKMYELGITAGCGTGVYCPNDPVTRGQMAVFVIRARLGAAADSSFTYPAGSYFTDVDTSNIYFKWIQRMRLDQITAGCGTNTYCPNDPVTRGQMAIFIMRGAFNLLLPNGMPVLAGASPAIAPLGQTVTVTLTGANTNFIQGTSQVSAGPGIGIGTVNVSNSTTLTVQLTVAANTATGPRTLVVTTGAEQAVLPNRLTVQ